MNIKKRSNGTAILGVIFLLIGAAIQCSGSGAINALAGEGSPAGESTVTYIRRGEDGSYTVLGQSSNYHASNEFRSGDGENYSDGDSPAEGSLREFLGIYQPINLGDIIKTLAFAASGLLLLASVMKPR